MPRMPLPHPASAFAAGGYVDQGCLFFKIWSIDENRDENKPKHNIRQFFFFEIIIPHL
jgi:hypothetical protein